MVFENGHNGEPEKIHMKTWVIFFFMFFENGLSGEPEIFKKRSIRMGVFGDAGDKLARLLHLEQENYAGKYSK